MYYKIKFNSIQYRLLCSDFKFESSLEKSILHVIFKCWQVCIMACVFQI